jgi:hypothetical protein
VNLVGWIRAIISFQGHNSEWNAAHPEKDLIDRYDEVHFRMDRCI